MTTHRVFVFGTLKQGFPNFATNTGARVPGEYATLLPHPLYLVGERHSPWMLAQPGAGLPVQGQVFEVDGAALQRMDALERIDAADGYRRVLLAVQRTDSPAAPSTVEVWAYLKPPEQLSASDIRVGPLACYTLAHAALYRPRAAA
jgi:gamma-glutamylaminecyclotransferase